MAVNTDEDESDLEIEDDFGPWDMDYTNWKTDELFDYLENLNSDKFGDYCDRINLVQLTGKDFEDMSDPEYLEKTLGVANKKHAIAIARKVADRIKAYRKAIQDKKNKNKNQNNEKISDFMNQMARARCRCYHNNEGKEKEMNVGFDMSPIQSCQHGAMRDNYSQEIQDIDSSNNPTNSDFEALKERVSKLEKELASMQKMNENENKNNNEYNGERMKNPFVIIVGMEDYSKSAPKGVWNDLDGPRQDVKTMSNLWNNIYGYDNMSIIYNLNNENSDNNKEFEIKMKNYQKYFPNQKFNSNDILSDKQTFCDFLVKIRSKIEANEENDGLIFYYSGHGIEKCIILANGWRLTISTIIDIFNGKECVELRGKPKIMIFDCCRGAQASETYLSKYAMDDNNNNSNVKTRGSQWVQQRFHNNSGLALIFANFANYSINDTEIGGAVTRAIEKVFEKPQMIKNKSLRDLILDIRRLTKIYSGQGNAQEFSSAQMVDFHETLEYKVYFDPKK